MLNPMQMLNQLGNVADPMQLIQNMISQNPQLGQYWNMAQKMTQGKTESEVQNIANNLLKQKGMNIGQIESMIHQIMGK